MASEKTIHYGVCGEGLGHLARAEFLAPILVEAGFRVVIHASGRAARLAPGRLPQCEHVEIPGLHFRYRDNGVDLAASALQYARIGWWWSGATIPRIWQNWARPPFAVVTDYEPVLARSRMSARVPHVAFDHQQLASVAAIAPGAGGAVVGTVGLAGVRALNAMIVGRPTLRVVTSFFQPELRPGAARDPRLHVIGPVLRPDVMARTATRGDHVVVYQTSASMAWLGDVLGRLPGEKRVYGGDAGVAGRGIVHRPADPSLFLDDLASCRFAVVNGGYTTICEALHYGKPVVCLPIRHQVEQELNAGWVAEQGFGASFRLGRGEVPNFAAFVDRLEEHERAIEARALPPGNVEARRLILGFLAGLEDRLPAAGGTAPLDAGGSAR